MGDKVVLEIVHFPRGPITPKGWWLKSLAAGEPDVETDVIAAHGLHAAFDDQTSMRRLVILKRPCPRRRGREDLTDRLIFTIDPDDSKDFDDAIPSDGTHVPKSGNLAFTSQMFSYLRIHLWIKRPRPTATPYLPRLVLPMLPEVLSNGVCSLQPGVERMAKSVFVTLDNKGKFCRERFAATVIRRPNSLRTASPSGHRL